LSFQDGAVTFSETSPKYQVLLHTSTYRQKSLPKEADGISASKLHSRILTKKQNPDIICTAHLDKSDICPTAA
jgi:hypothetical protein